MSYFSQFYIPMTFLLKQFLSFLPFPGFLLLYLVGAEKNKKNAPLFNSKKRSCLLSICLIRKSVLSKKSAQLFSFWFSFLFTVCRFFSVAVISRCSFFWLAAIWHNRTLPVFLSFALFSRSAKKLLKSQKIFQGLVWKTLSNSSSKQQYQISVFLFFALFFKSSKTVTRAKRIIRDSSEKNLLNSFSTQLYHISGISLNYTFFKDIKSDWEKNYKSNLYRQGLK